jgi:hypothetical protein
MGKTRRFALMLGLSAAVCVDTRAALADPTTDEAAGDNSSTVEGTESSDARRERRGRSPEEIAARKAERHANRRERLEQGAKRLRERAAEMRKKAAAGESPPSSGKRQPRSYEEQAQRLEGQAAKMEERAKNVDNDEAARPGRDKDPASARQRRHQVRRGHLNRRWGATLRDPAAVEELKVHAERAAKLKRIRSLALKKSKDDPAAKRATELLTKETARHEKRMSELHGKTPPGAAPASTAPAQEKAE